MICTSLTKCRVERHERVECKRCREPVCVHTIVAGRCIECDALRIAAERRAALGHARQEGAE